MNQHQRKFLLESIEKQHRRERDELKDSRPHEPSLNNYLIAAILDGSFKLKTEKQLRDALRKRVRDLGKGESLLTHRDAWNRGSEAEMVAIPADILFELPVEYAQELEKFQQAYQQWSDRIKALDAACEAMKIKVQIGSDKALEALVNQADTLCSMSLTASSKLLLTEKSAS